MKIRTWSKISLPVLLILAASVGIFGQSTSQEYPTAIVTNEISGTVKARDIGDSRLTTYYYALNGDQGDLFLNLVTKNFTGDIDVFTVNGLRPMTKIVVYADATEVETGRAIYLRKPEKLILRVQGRTPNDEAATFRLKFAGSFVAAKADDLQAEPEVPRVSTTANGAVRVNSVGTIIPSPPRAVEPVAEKSDAVAEPRPEAEETSKVASPDDTIDAAPKKESRVLVTDALKKTEPEKGAARRSSAPRTRPAKPPKPETSAKAEPVETISATQPEKTTEPPSRTLSNNRRSRTPKKMPEPVPDPLASISLIIQLKDGNSIEKKMNEVFKFSVDKGVLTVILKDGAISRYPIVDVAKVTIE